MQYTQLSRRSAGGKIDWEKQYLTFIPVEDARFSWAERAVSGHLEYSVNGGQTWMTIANGESTPTITAGSKVIWRGDLKPKYAETNIGATAGIGMFSASGNYHAYGNTMSLLFYDNYYGSQLAGTGYSQAFVSLWFRDTHILTAPLLPSTILSVNCYYQMFYGCTRLTTAPELPATILAVSCYRYMFSDCTSLTTVPELTAITLTKRCYYGMFSSCRKLNYIKCLATDISASNCTTDWVKNVTSTGTFVKAAEMEDWPTGASGIPLGWTVVDDNS